MGMTITEKILADHAGLKKVSPGDLIDAEIDVIMGHDLSTPLAIKEMERIGAKRVFDPEKIVIVPDHFTPNKDLKAAETCKVLRNFCRSQGINNYFEVGRMGISHALLPEQGLVLPGDLVVGGDSPGLFFYGHRQHGPGGGHDDGEVVVQGPGVYEICLSRRSQQMGMRKGSDPSYHCRYRG